MNPYIEAEPSVPKIEAMPQLKDAAEKADKLRATAIRYRNEHAITRSVLGYATFGAAAAGGVAALYDAHRDLVLGLGLAAGGTYTAGSLFVGTEKIGIYSAAGRALDCVVDTAATGLHAYATLAGLTKSGGPYEIRYEALKTKIAAGWGRTWKTSDPPQIKDAKLALAEYEAAKSNLELFRHRDGDFATAINKSARTILQAMEQRLDAVQPDLDTLRRSAESIGAFGVAFAKRVTPIEDQGTSTQQLLTSDAEQLAALIPPVKDAASQINDRLTATTNTLSQVGTQCVLNVASVLPLSTGQKQVTLSPNQTVTLTLSGGKLPLTTSWQGATPTRDQIEAITSSGREVILVGKADLPTGQTFTLVVRDSLAAPSEVLIEVKTPGAALSAQPDKVSLPSGGAAQVVALTGGKAPYDTHWLVKPGTTAPDKIAATASNGSISLKADTGATKGTYQLRISDGSTPTQTKDIEVTVTDP